MSPDRKNSVGRWRAPAGYGWHSSASACDRNRNIPARSRHLLDFAGVNRAALPALPTLVARWLPGGRVEGREYVALNPRRADRSLGSFKVKLFGARAGAWADFATGERGGDVISLAAYVHGLSQAEACRRLARMLGIDAGERHG